MPGIAVADNWAKWIFEDDFVGAQLYAAQGQGSPWVITDTSAAGTPTYVVVDGAAGPGELAIDMDTTTEAQNVCLSFGDQLALDIDLVQGFACRLKTNQAALDATTMLAFGVTGDRNDTIDTIAQAALFRVVGADDTTAVVVESDDGTNNNDDIATGQTLLNAYKWFQIDFSQGTDDVRFFMADGDGSLKRVASGTTFDMSNYTGALQPFFQIQKTSDANADGFTIDYVRVWGNRS